jgi:nucleoside-diphosphate-sugar epimerase
MALYLVTGGAGFIGSHILEALVLRGDRVRVLDDFSTGRRANIQHLPVEVIEGDIRHLEVVRAATRGVDYVIHEAALVSVTQSIVDPLSTHEVNATGTLNVLMTAREFDVKRVVLASSCAVYGDNDALPLQESAELRPKSPYAASKRIGEIYCQMYHTTYGVPTVCLRYFNVFGPRQDPNGDYAAVIPRFLHRMLAGQVPIIYGDGLQTRDFVHVSEVVRANLLACASDVAIGQVFNIASGQSVSLLYIVDVINQVLETTLPAKFELPRSGDIRHSVGDPRYAETRLGFRVCGSFVKHLTETIRALQTVELHK